MPVLSKRYGYYNGDCYLDANGNEQCNQGVWDSWVRWLVLGLVVAGAILLFFLFSCITARKRRRNGYQPYRGTGWALGMTPQGHAAPTYTGNTAGNTQQPYYQSQQQQQQPYYNNSNAPPPAYSPAQNANQNQNQGWYGNAGVTEPSAAYRGEYEPPKDPPPNRL